ncbi:nucleotidyltransferase family protein [Amycolatopsis sp. cg5]|uniref:nucleotidyltransferase family protein n=1 Tax=Amycolatopsis sp. cg5 TaxID=3238802 RepID=UPI00352345DD
MSFEHIDHAMLREICLRYGVDRLSVFGSVARNEDTPSSDIDLIYSLAPGVQLGWEIEDLADELAKFFGRPVDLVSRRALHPLLRDDVLAEAKPVYAA